MLIMYLNWTKEKRKGLMFERKNRDQWIADPSEVINNCGGWSWTSKLIEVVISMCSIWIDGFRNRIVMSDDKDYHVTMEVGEWDGGD